MKENSKGLTAIVICAILWSSSGLFIKIIDWNPMAIAGIRSFIAFLFMLFVRQSKRRKNTARSKPFPFVMGGVSYAATMVLFVIANKLTASANVILLQYTAPVWAALLGWLIAKEKPRLEHWGALLAVSVGLMLFFKDGLTQGSMLGNAIAVLSGICFGAYSVFMRLQKDGNTEDSIILSHAIAFMFCLPFIVANPPKFDTVSAFSILALGLVQIGLASLFFAYGIRRVSAVQAMLTAVVEPVLNPVWVFVVTAETPGASALAGGAVILTAVIASSLLGIRRTEVV